MLSGADAGVWEQESDLWWLLSVLVIKAGEYMGSEKKDKSVKIIKSTPDLDEAFPEYHQHQPHASWAGIFLGYHAWIFSWSQMCMGVGSAAFQWCSSGMESGAGVTSWGARASPLCTPGSQEEISASVSLATISCWWTSLWSLPPLQNCTVGGKLIPGV